MWWVVLLAGMAWMLFRFFSDYNEQDKQMAQQGGVRKKYARLVEYCLSGHPDCRVMNESNTSILIGCRGMSGSTTFDIVQTFGNVTIQYKVDSVVFGKHKLEWEFNENMSQEAMIERINQDVSDYTVKMMSKYK